MPLKAPKWWFKKRHPLSYILSPVGFLYGSAVKARYLFSSRYRSSLPVICIGNFTVGGGGKTPFVIEVAKLLIEDGKNPIFLTRGYGGKVRGTHLLDLAKDGAEDVGDEPLLLAQTAPVIVRADRKAGASFIENLNADVILMDDGFQNPTLQKDLSIVVIDEMTGLGNGCIFPAGPLRTDLSFQLQNADALVFVGTSEQKVSGPGDLAMKFKGPVLHGSIEAVGDTSWLDDLRVISVAGIANPSKFYSTLEQYGADIVECCEVPDHYMFTEADAEEILGLAELAKASIVMTEKDWVRLPETGARGRLKQVAKVVKIKLVIEEEDVLRGLVNQAIASPS